MKYGIIDGFEFRFHRVSQVQVFPQLIDHDSKRSSYLFYLKVESYVTPEPAFESN